MLGLQDSWGLRPGSWWQGSLSRDEEEFRFTQAEFEVMSSCPSRWCSGLWTVWTLGCCCCCRMSVTARRTGDWFFHETWTQQDFWSVIVSDVDVMSQCYQNKQNMTSLHCNQNQNQNSEPEPLLSHKEGNVCVTAAEGQNITKNNNNSKK